MGATLLRAAGVHLGDLSHVFFAKRRIHKCNRQSGRHGRVLFWTVFRDAERRRYGWSHQRRRTRARLARKQVDCVVVLMFLPGTGLRPDFCVPNKSTAWRVEVNEPATARPSLADILNFVAVLHSS